MDQKTLKLAYWLLKDINRAIVEYSMIRDGDRVAVALSGGKDSLSLLNLLKFRKESARERYDVVAVHVAADARGNETPQHLPLMEWLNRCEFEYSIVTIETASDEKLPMNCQRCTWNRRKALFSEAIRLGCTVVAFGHHADDLAQTTLLNLIFHGKVETMAPTRHYFDGLLRVVRPLCYTAENDLRRFARHADFPPPPPDCPQSKQSRRELVKEMLRTASAACPGVRDNLLRAGLQGTGTWEGQN